MSRTLSNYCDLISYLFVLQGGVHCFSKEMQGSKFRAGEKWLNGNYYQPPFNRVNLRKIKHFPFTRQELQRVSRQ